MPYEEYFKSATEGLVIIDRTGRIVEANRWAERLFGYSENELVSQPVELLVPGQLREIHGRHVHGYFAAPRTRAMGSGLSLAGRRKDGSEFPVEISLTHARGTARGDLVVAAVVDISQRLELERRVRRAETLVSTGTLAGGIAHDLNNPLQVIRSRCELIGELPETTPLSSFQEDIDAIRRQTEHANAVIERFLELSRQRANVLGPVDVNELVGRTLLLASDQLRKSGIYVQTRLDRGLPEIRGDAIALERVLINLLTNARDAMPEGGAVEIASGLATEEPQWLLLTVTDTGLGISPDVLGKLFNLLYTTKSDGSGLGLWLSRRIIQEHNGRIEVQSELGKGTTFTIRLPTSDC